MPDAPERSIAQQSVGEAGGFFKFVYDALSDDTVRAQVLSDLGLDPANGTTKPQPDYVAHLDSIDLYRKTVDPDKEAFAAAIKDLQALYTAVTAVIEASSVGTQEANEELYHRCVTLL